MTREELTQIIVELLEKTRKGEVPWAEPEGILSVLYPDYVMLKLPKSSIIIRRQTGVAAIDFTISNEKGVAVATLRVLENDSLHKPLSELLSLATKRTKHVDETLKDVRDFLGNKPGGA